MKSTGMDELITSDNSEIKDVLKKLEDFDAYMENLTKDCVPLLNGEKFLTDKELSEKLKIGRRTLQDYRTEGKLPFIALGGKTLYRESDIEKFLESNYQKFE